MEREEVKRARALLVTTAQSAGLWAIGRVSHWALIARTRIDARLAAQLGSQVPPRVQRFGKNLWQRITTRFPALADLLHEGLAAPAPGASPAPYPPPPSPAINGAARHVQVAPAEPIESLDALIAELRGPSAELAAVAAIKLGARREPEAIQALRQALDNCDGYYSPLTRVAALQAFAHTLTQSPSLEDLEPVLSLVRDIDAEVSMAAIDAVVQRAPANVAIDRLLPVVLDESGYFLPIVRAAATRALERAGLLTTASA